MDGTLPSSDSIVFDSDAELKRELEALRNKLGSMMDWVDRIQALIRLEGIVRGGADRWPLILERLKNLKDPLVAQISDRRSAVSRQACHVIAVMAVSFGQSFEPLAVFFLPILTKVLPIAIQVMADAANVSIHSILHYCRCSKIVPKIAEGVISDKNPKIRQHCATYLLQICDCWSLGQSLRTVDVIFQALGTALQDASSETRRIGRMAVAALCQTVPEKGKIFLKSLDGSIRQRLSEIIPAYKRGLTNFPCVLLDTDADVPFETSVGKTSTPGIPMVLDLVASPKPDDGERGDVDQFQESQTAGSGIKPLIQSTPCQTPRKTMAVELPSKRTSQCFSIEKTQPSFSDFSTDISGPARFHIGSFSVDTGRQVKSRQLQTPEKDTRRLPSVDETGRDQLSVPLGKPCRLGRKKTGVIAQHDPRRPSPIPEEQKREIKAILAQAMNQPHDWNIKEKLALQLSEILATDEAGSSELAGSLHQLTTVLCSYLDDPHHKVVGTALKVVGQCFEKHHGAVEIPFSRLAPILFLKLIDQRESVRKTASDVLQSCGKCYPLDVILGVSLHSLSTLRMPKAIPEILSYVTKVLSQFSEKDLLENGSFVRRWLCHLFPLVEDKRAPVRQSAHTTLNTFIRAIPRESYQLYISQVDPQEQMTLVRGLRQFYPHLLPENPSVRKSPMKRSTPDRHHSASPGRRSITPRKRRTETRQDPNTEIQKVLHQCLDLKEVEKLDHISALTDRINPAALHDCQLQAKTAEGMAQILLTSKSAVREQTLILMTDVFSSFSYHPSQATLSILLQSLLTAASDSSELVSMAVDILLETLVKPLTASVMLKACLESFTSCQELLETDACFVCFLKILLKLLRCVDEDDDDEVEQTLAQTDFAIVDMLIRGWQSKEVRVRMYVVFTLARLKAKIGPHRLQPLLASLTEPQQKLLQSWTRREMEK